MKQDAATAKDLAGLWRDYKRNGSAQAKDAIIVQYLGLVKFIAGRVAMNSPPHVEEDDLIGWGVLGLLDAVEKFDLEQNVSFETYASVRIRGAIIDQIRSLDWAPRSLRQKARHMEQATAKLRESLGREPTGGELASEMTITEDELFGLITEIHGAYVLSLDSVVSGESDDEVTLEEVTSDLKSPSPESSARRKEAEQCLATAIARLPENERYVITLYYYDELTLKEIGKVMGLTESRICQIHREVIRKLKQTLKASSHDAIY
ncbi:FliA/WhiG family RNA polymerase sigma factor [Candidatus Poribacteria bacterium]|nr:FliA/WhiG family RNA polymerase sigma factor [Candidatus Poribacteria bacterium]